MSESKDFVPVDCETVPGFRGCFFYLDPESEDELNEYIRGWYNRYPSYWEAPDEIVEIVQSFDPGEVGNRYEVVELFIKSENLYLVQPIR